MNLMTNIICPISFERIDSNVSRLSIFTLVVLMAIFLITGNPLWLAFVVLDYSFRATGNGQYSILTIIYQRLVKTLNIQPKMIDKAQKTFAARLGWLCSAAGLVLIIMGFSTAAVIVTVMLAVLSTLDSVGNLCVGCLIYNYLVYPFFNK